MCGIAAAFDWDGAQEVVEALLKGIAHRGEVTDPVIAPRAAVALGTRRLRIVDGEGGAQPMASADGRLLVAFNGEIYNHRALRLDLEAAGVRFRTGSDTEVLANALQVWGSAGLARLRGMFAFVAVDAASGRFLAARDPFGEKPLYVLEDQGRRLFCSEIRPLLQASPTGDALLIPPGWAVTAGGCRPFYALPAPERVCAEDDPRALDALLEAAVERCTPPDLPFATFFSGGIDSTLIAHYARRRRPEAPGYFLGGPEAPDYPFAARYAEASGMDLRLAPLDGLAGSPMSAVEATVAAVESFEPAVVRPSLCYAALAEAAQKDGFRVVLTGEGADELFAGYVPLEAGFSHSEACGRDLRDQCLALMNRSSLQRTDRTAMRRQIEARSPFLDQEVVAHAFGLGREALLEDVDGAARGKAPLRRLYDLYPAALPREIRDRKKVPVNEGAGLDVSQTQSTLRARVEATISDAEFRFGQSAFRAFDLRTKEEYAYLRALAKTMDVHRAPHLKGRLRLSAPDLMGSPAVAAYRA